MILWSNGDVSHVGTTLSLTQRPVLHRDTGSYVDHIVGIVWQTGLVAADHVAYVSGNDYLYIVRAEIDATPDVVELAEAWRAERAYEDAERAENVRGCAVKHGCLALVCAHPWRGYLYRYNGQHDIRATLKKVGDYYADVEIDSFYSAAQANAIFRCLTNVAPDLVEVTGVVEGDQPAWAHPVTVLSNKSRELGYAVMRRMAHDPDLLARVEAHGRIAVEMAGQRLPTSWFKENNRLFGMG